MKILKNIITGIGIVAALLCALIIFSAVNPGITNTLSSLLSGNGLPVQEEEPEAPEEPDESDQTEDASLSDVPSDTPSEMEGGTEDNAALPEESEAVSYTHLTLPTIA